MTSNHRQDTYTMPLKQLLRLLESTADDAPRDTRRQPRRRDAKPAATVPVSEPEYFRF